MRKLLFILLGIASLNTFSQTIIKKQSLPLLVEKDTLIIKTAVWIQTEDSEIEQRAVNMKLRNKLSEIGDILEEKKKNEKAIDSTICEMKRVVKVKDSLNKVLEDKADSIVDECTTKLFESADKYKELAEEKAKKEEKINILNKRLIILSTVIIVETGLIILIL